LSDPTPSLISAPPTSPTLSASTQPVTVVTTTVVPSTPAAPAAPGGFGDVVLPVVLSATVVAAVVTSAINVWLARMKRHDEAQARVRARFAEAYRAYAEYKEMPYCVRRRDPARGAEERLRLSEQMRKIQSDLTFYVSWTALEAPEVGARYAELVAQLRRVAGAAIREAWLAPGTRHDRGMNIPPALVDLSSLSAAEAAYTEAVKAHFAGGRRRRRWRR
jgi:hypothetical protein